MIANSPVVIPKPPTKLGEFHQKSISAICTTLGRGSAYASSYTIQGLASRTVFPAFSQSTIHNPFFSPTSSQCFHNPQSTIRVPLPSSFSESTIHNPTLIAITIYLARHGHLVWFPFWSDHCINPDETNSFKKQNVFPFQAQ